MFLNHIQSIYLSLFIHGIALVMLIDYAPEKRKESGVERSTELVCILMPKVREEAILERDNVEQEEVISKEEEESTEQEESALDQHSYNAVTDDSKVSKVAQKPVEEKHKANKLPSGEFAIFGIKGKSSYLSVCFDVSASVGDELDMIKAEVKDCLRSLPDDAHFNLGAFNSELHQFGRDWHSMKDFDGALLWLGQLKSGGGTRPLKAMKNIERLRPAPGTFILVTDGESDYNSWWGYYLQIARERCKAVYFVRINRNLNPAFNVEKIFDKN